MRGAIGCCKQIANSALVNTSADFAQHLHTNKFSKEMAVVQSCEKELGSSQALIVLLKCWPLMQVLSSRKLWKSTSQRSSFTTCKPEGIKAIFWCIQKLVYSIPSFLQPLHGMYHWGMKCSEVSFSSHGWFWYNEKRKWPQGTKSKLTDVSSSPAFLLATQSNGSILITIPYTQPNINIKRKILRAGNEDLLWDSAASEHVFFHILTEPGINSTSDTQRKVYLFCSTFLAVVINLACFPLQ